MAAKKQMHLRDPPLLALLAILATFSLKDCVNLSLLLGGYWCLTPPVGYDLRLLLASSVCALGGGVDNVGESTNCTTSVRSPIFPRPLQGPDMWIFRWVKF